MSWIIAWASRPSLSPNTRLLSFSGLTRRSSWRAKSRTCKHGSGLRYSLMTVLASLCLLMLLSSCVSQPIVHTVPVEKKVRQWVPVPAEHIAPMDVPGVPPFMLWGDALELNAALYGVIEQCQYDRGEIRRLHEHTIENNARQAQDKQAQASINEKND